MIILIIILILLLIISIINNFYMYNYNSKIHPDVKKQFNDVNLKAVTLTILHNNNQLLGKCLKKDKQKNISNRLKTDFYIQKLLEDLKINNIKYIINYNNTNIDLK